MIKISKSIGLASLLLTTILSPAQAEPAILKAKALPPRWPILPVYR